MAPCSWTPSLYSVQLGVSAAALALSAGMLLAGGDAAVYLPVVTSIAGYWMPAPVPPPPEPEPLSTAASCEASSPTTADKPAEKK